MTACLVYSAMNQYTMMYLSNIILSHVIYL